MDSNDDLSNGATVAAHTFNLDVLQQQLKDLDVLEIQIGQSGLRVEQCLTSAASEKHNWKREEGTAQAHLTDALKLLEIQRALLSTLRPMFCNMRETVHKAMDVCSPIAIQPLNILLLPDEILTEIFKQIKNYKKNLI